MNKLETAKRRGVYLIPSAFTLANMAMGFYAIVAGFNEEYTHGAVAILIGHIMDMFDGRVARWTGTESRFGVEFDSLADWISFGIAPALLIYNLALEQYGKWGFLLALFFAVCGALRLARFNVKAQDSHEAAGYFVGLPIPAAGGSIAVFVLVYTMWAEGNTAKTFKILMNQIPILYQVVPLIVFVLALLMVSNVQYTSFKKMNLMRPRSLRALMGILLGGFMIYAYPHNTIFILYVVYVSWGLIDYLWRASRLKLRKSEVK